MSHAVNLRGRRVALPDWLTRQHTPMPDYTAMTHHVGSAFSLTALALGVAELGRVMIEPVTGPIYAFAGPPISPEDWEKWWPLISSASVSLVGLWGVIQNKLKSGLKAELEQLRKDLSDASDKADAREVSYLEKIEKIHGNQIKIVAWIRRHSEEGRTAKPPEPEPKP